MSEHDEQANLISWANLWVTHIPELATLYAIPNAQKFGSATNEQKIRTIAKLKAEGLKPGVPDLHLPVSIQMAPGKWGSLFIEMKYKNNKPSEDQIIYANYLSDQYNHVVVCWSWQDAAHKILDHIMTARLQRPPHVVDYETLTRARDSIT